VVWTAEGFASLADDSYWAMILTPEHGRTANLGEVRRVENDIGRLLTENSADLA